MFELLKTDSPGKARLGRLTTAHGAVDTPVFMPVGTQGSVKALDPRELREMGTQIILGNTYHLSSAFARSTRSAGISSARRAGCTRSLTGQDLF